MYVSGDVYMREAADKDAKAVTFWQPEKKLPFSEKKATGIRSKSMTKKVM